MRVVRVIRFRNTWTRVPNPFRCALSLTERGAVSSIEPGVVGVAFDEDVAVVEGRVVVAARCDDICLVGWAALGPGDDVVEV